MKILVLKESKATRPNLMVFAAIEAFSQCGDVVNVATIKADSVLHTAGIIKELIKRYEPDIVMAQKMLASVLLFETPKTVKKILVDPYLLYTDKRDDGLRLTIAVKYNSVRWLNWLQNATEKQLFEPDEKQIRNCYVIVRDFATDLSDYGKLVEILYENKNLFLSGSITGNMQEDLSSYHVMLNKARTYLDPDFEMPNVEELLKK